MSEKDKSIDDELVDYVTLNKHLEDDTNRKKKQTLLEFEEMGEQYLNEIDKKRKFKEINQKKLIPYIMKHSSGVYSEEELLSYSPNDVQEIYDNLKKEKRPFFIKIFHFIFGLEY